MLVELEGTNFPSDVFQALLHTRESWRECKDIAQCAIKVDVCHPGQKISVYTLKKSKGFQWLLTLPSAWISIASFSLTRLAGDKHTSPGTAVSNSTQETI